MNLFSIKYYNYKITSLFPISKTFASFANFPKPEIESFMLEPVFTRIFSRNRLLSLCLTLTFLNLFHIRNLGARYVLATQAGASMSVSSSTSCHAIYYFPTHRSQYRQVLPTPSNILVIYFRNPLLKLAPQL